MPRRYTPVEFFGLWYVLDAETNRLTPCENREVAEDHAARLNLMDAIRRGAA